MGIFGKIFGSGEDQPEKDRKGLPWKELHDMDQLEAIAEASTTKTQVIFKHSTRCGISRMVLRNFENDYDLQENQVDLYYLDLLNNRQLSTEIGVKFQVLHESPQLIVVRNGETVYHESHGAITPETLHRFV